MRKDLNYIYARLDYIKVSRSIINACIYEYDKDKLIIVINEINKQGNIVYLLDEIRSLVKEIPYNRLNLIASVILNIQGEFKGENSRVILHYLHVI